MVSHKFRNACDITKERHQSQVLRPPIFCEMNPTLKCHSVGIFLSARQNILLVRLSQCRKGFLLNDNLKEGKVSIIFLRGPNRHQFVPASFDSFTNRVWEREETRRKSAFILAVS